MDDEHKIGVTGGDWRMEDKILINPSWIIQSLILGLLAVSGYFINGTMQSISQEISLSRIERAQIRADLSALEIGLRGDRFTLSDWNREADKLEKEHDSIKERLRQLEVRR